MNPLHLQKQLLIAESELNRAQLVGDITALKADVRSLAKRATSINSFATAVLSLVTVCASNLSSTAAPEKSAWWQTILKSAQPIAALWTVFRNRPK